MLPKNKVLRVNCKGYGEDALFNRKSARLLSEYSAIIVDPLSVCHIFESVSISVLSLIISAREERKSYIAIEDSDFDGALCSNEFKLRRQEFQKFFAKGGLLVCFLEPFFVVKLVKPVGVHGHVQATYTFHNYAWLPKSLGGVKLMYSGHGSEVVPTEAGSDSNFADYLHCKYIEWRTLVAEVKAHAKATILAKNVDGETVAFSINIGEGKAVFLPPYTIDLAEKILIRCVDAEVEELRLEGPPPAEWTKKFPIPGMSKLQKEIGALDTEIDKLDKKKKRQEGQFRNLERIRDTLLNRSGRILKETVINILKEFGLNAMPGPEVRDDVIIKEGGKTIVTIEVKGTKSSTGEGDATQLGKWVDRVFEEEGHVPKGILLVNAYKDDDPSDGRDEAFPDQMLRYCRGRQFCLLTTLQLFNMYCDFKRGNIRGQEILKQLMDCVGVYEGYTDLSKNLVENEGT